MLAVPPQSSPAAEKTWAVSTDGLRRTSKVWVELLLLTPFLALFYVQLIHHPMWIDELNAWAIAAASPTLPRLFHLIHYEAHPSLWYLLLWAVSRWTASPAALKAVEGVIGTAIYLYLALRSPFTRGEKALLYLSYFIVFEYTVLSRMYGLLLLLVMIYAQQRATRPDRVLTNAVLLALMANTDMMGILMSAAFALEYLIERVKQKGARGAGIRLLVAALIYLGGTAAAIETLRPAADIRQLNVDLIFAYTWSLPHLRNAAVAYLALPWFPIAKGFPHHFWNPVVHDHRDFYYLISPVIVGMEYLIFRRERNLLLIVGLIAVNAILFMHLVFYGWTRQHGVAFLAFLAALWMQRYVRPRGPALAWVFLGLSAAGGVMATIAQWDHPFSNSQVIVKYIRAHHLENEPLMGAFSFSVGPVGEIMQRRMYFVDCNCSDTFVQYDSRGDAFAWEQMPDRLQRAMKDLGQRKALLLTAYPLSNQVLAEIGRRSLRITPLATFPESEAKFEGTVLYSVTE